MHRNVLPTVLVVDDQPAIADLYAYRLSRSYNVRTAYSGEAALATVEESVDVVLLDRRMDDVCGDDVLRAIRRRGLDVRVAMVTAVEPDFDVLELGFDAYVVKPATETTILQTVESLLDLAAYDEETKLLCSIVSRIATIETEYDETTLAENEEYRALRTEADRLQATVTGRLQSFDDEELRATFHRIGRSDPARAR